MTEGKGTVLILGATGGIARALARNLALSGHDLYLAGRDADELERCANDVRLRTRRHVAHGPFDADDSSGHKQWFDQMVEEAGPIAGVVMSFGQLTPQDECEKDWRACEAMLQRNLTGAMSVLHAAADHLESAGSGWIVALSSVAGDRGRRSNYVYGAAKAGLTVFLQGLRARLVPSGVHVLTVKPGPVDTGMTFGMDKLPLLAQPEAVAAAVTKAIRKKQDVLYVPAPWRLVMFVLRNLPEQVMKKTKL